MTLKTLFDYILAPKAAATPAVDIRRVRSNGFDVKSLRPTRPLTEAEKAERYRTGRFAEMTDAQAGL